MKKRGTKKRVILLGAAGRIGTGFIEEYKKNKSYKKKYELILGIHDKKFRDKNFEIKYIELNDIKTLERAFKGVDVVVNLAANPNPDATFKDLIKPNLVGSYNVFEAARISKCKRVIFASSVHAIEGYGHGKQVKDVDAPKPIDFYGASKVFGEALCYVFFSKYGLSCLAIRIGAYTSDDKMRTLCFSRHDYDHVISQRDMCQLIHKCITAPQKIGYGILSGISNNTKKDMDLKLAKRIVGYKPQDNSYNLCKKIKLINLDTNWKKTKFQ